MNKNLKSMLVAALFGVFQTVALLMCLTAWGLFAWTFSHEEQWLIFGLSALVISAFAICLHSKVSSLLVSELDNFRA